jgi:hypothetical protein
VDQISSNCDDESRMFLRNVRVNLQSYVVSKHRRLQYDPRCSNLISQVLPVTLFASIIPTYIGITMVSSTEKHHECCQRAEVLCSTAVPSSICLNSSTQFSNSAYDTVILKCLNTISYVSVVIVLSYELSLLPISITS